jgi:nucleoside-diphosphate-sugar epimerase
VQLIESHNLRDALQKDVIIISGGDTEHLIGALGKHRFRDLLMQAKPRTVLGISAGAIAIARQGVGTKNGGEFAFEGMNCVDVFVVPHSNDERKQRYPQALHLDEYEWKTLKFTDDRKEMMLVQERCMGKIYPMRPTVSKFLVTGARGFIGSNLCGELLKLGQVVVGVDLRGSKCWSLLDEIPASDRSRLTVIQGDICDLSFTKELVEAGHFAAIFNAAASAAVIEKAQYQPLQSLIGNFCSIATIAEAVRVSKNRPLIVHLSSDKIYGDTNGVQCTEATNFGWGGGIYEASKISGEVAANSYSRVFRVPLITLRLCNIIGRGDCNFETRLLPRAMKQIFDGETPRPPQLYKEAQNHYRDYLFIDDLVSMLIATASRRDLAGHTFNIPPMGNYATAEMLNKLVEAA